MVREWICLWHLVEFGLLEGQKANSKIYGDAIRETNSGKAGTSEDGWKYSSWTSDYSFFPALHAPFFLRGSDFWSASHAGVCTFNCNNGGGVFNSGFRAVLVNK